MTPTEGIKEFFYTFFQAIIEFVKVFGIYILIAILIGFVLKKLFGRR